MERSFVLVLTLVTLGTATPYGYGVKGGASAKAEASAVAGAFGDIAPLPLSIPSGSGFSGSFSKSSASSFASSSASSSSSSYSFSGSGANGIGGAGTGKGCSTCPGAGAPAPSNGAPQFSGANAVSAAQAKAAAGSYAPCQGSNCNGSPPEKCTSGYCLPDSSQKGQSGCTGNGNCQTPSTGSEPSNAGSLGKGEKDKEEDNLEDSNDFAVNINRNPQSKLSHGSNGQNSDLDRSYNPQSDCSNGKCTPSNPYQTSLSSSQGQPSVPSSYLTTPNKNPPCTTPDCHYPLNNNGPQNGGLPSSYNVPIQSATNPPIPTSGHSSASNSENSVPSSVPCTSPGCSSPSYNTGAPNIPNYNVGQQRPGHGHASNPENGVPSSVPCTSPGCSSPSYNNGAPNIPNYNVGQQRPGHGYASNPENSVASSVPCTSPGCSSPSYNVGASSIPNYNVGQQRPGHGSAPNSGNNVPSSVPCTSPSCNSSPYNTGASNIPNYNVGQPGHSSQGPCSTGLCGNPSSSNGKPDNFAVSSSKPPSYSHGTVPSNVPSSYSGQQGCTSPYCSGLPTNQPGSGCSGGSCTSSSPAGLPAKPSDAPVYTGGFGGPAGFLDINSGSNKVSGNSAHNYGHNTPSTSGPSGAYGTSSTHGTFGASNTNHLNSNNNYGSTQTSSNGGSTGSFGNHKPSSGSLTPGSQLNPSPTGNHGVQTPEDDGSYKPTTDDAGSSSVYSGGIGTTGSSQISSGSNLIHGSFGVAKPNTPSHSLSSPAYTTNYAGTSGSVGGSSPSYGLSGSKPGSGNCGSTGCNGQSINVNGGSTSYDKTSSSTANQNKPEYNGGFGGPAGLLNPNNVNVPSNTPTTSGNNACKNGKCGSNGTPTSYQGSSSSQNLVAAAAASANAVAYTGGFGGPPGLLKPYDDGKVPAHGNLANGHSLSSNNGHPHASSPNAKNSEPANLANGANAVAQASATASATAGSYGGNNNHQDNNGSSHGCNSGCSSNGAGDGSTGLPGGFSTSGLGAGSLAAAKSNAVAYGNFASSSASAHATAGAATKGGYGRK